MAHRSDRPRSPLRRAWPSRSGRPPSRPIQAWPVTDSDYRERRTRRRSIGDSRLAAEDRDGDSEAVERVDRDGNRESDGDTSSEDAGDVVADRDSGGDRDDGRSVPRTGTGVRSLTMSTDDRQVLVVGGGLAGLAVTATLRQVGYDPVLLAEPDRTHPSRLAVLHPVGRTLLDDVTADALQMGDSDVVRLDSGDGQDGTTLGESHQPVALTTEDLMTRLTAAIPDGAVREDGVRTLEQDGDALHVRFESGVREWFDLVVAADGPGSTVRGVRTTSLDTDHATQVEARLDTDSELPPARRESWTDRGFVQALPHPHGGHLVRLTSPAFADDDRSPSDRLNRAVDAFDRAGLDPSDPAAVRQTEVLQCPPEGGHWGDGRVAYCGGAALSQAPATGLDATLALADARVFADELLAGPSAVSDAVDAYGRRRRRYLERLREAATDGSQPEVPVDASPALASVRRFRSASRGGDLLVGPREL